ncbi:hypothetical protein FCI23_55610 [Actinacidiphila oryziradicis]|uniref:Uncharacterized protein n=1 Tax=Actinacidiphila oryziradicis TaxID=2571141 RepID=A0A4V5MVC3_9ACTN|nr:hypothetical protein FCI23_55610 [Actinacidiphila oryziradicis]
MGREIRETLRTDERAGNIESTPGMGPILGAEWGPDDRVHPGRTPRHAPPRRAAHNPTVREAPRSSTGTPTAVAMRRSSAVMGRSLMLA